MAEERSEDRRGGAILALQDRLKLHAYELTNGGATASILISDLRDAAAALEQAEREIEECAQTIQMAARLSRQHDHDRGVLEQGINEAWEDVLTCVQQAWPEPQDYGDCPTDLITRVIDERDEARAELEAERLKCQLCGASKAHEYDVGAGDVILCERCFVKAAEAQPEQEQG